MFASGKPSFGEQAPRAHLPGSVLWRCCPLRPFAVQFDGRAGGGDARRRMRSTSAASCAAPFIAPITSTESSELQATTRESPRRDVQAGPYPAAWERATAADSLARRALEKPALPCTKPHTDFIDGCPGPDLRTEDVRTHHVDECPMAGWQPMHCPPPHVDVDELTRSLGTAAGMRRRPHHTAKKKE